jgi:hypothetical protein
VRRMPKVRLQRDSSIWGRWRRMDVAVDGATVGKLAAGAVLECDADPGVHTVRVKLGFTRKTVDVDVREDEDVVLATGVQAVWASYSLKPLPRLVLDIVAGGRAQP